MAKYSSMLPELEYNGASIKDITHRIALLDYVSEYSFMFYKQKIENEMTPEKLSLALYNNQDYWWIICAINNIIDPFYDWIMLETEVYAYAEKLYDNINDIHHWEDNEYNQFDEDSPENDRVPITNIEWEIHKNELKRSVRIVKMEYISKIEKEFKMHMKKIPKQKQEE